MTKQAGRMKRVLVAAMFLIVAISIGKPMQTQAAQQPVSVTKCKLSANKKTLTVKAKVKKKTGAMGSKLYLVGLGAHAKEAGKVSTVPLANVKAKKGTITFKANYQNSMLFQKFAVAYKKGKKYVITSGARYIENPSVLASYTGPGPAASSKKGILAEELSDTLDLGVQHVTLNWTLSSIMNQKAAHKISFRYKNKTYELDEDVLKENDRLVQAYNAAGVRVTAILLLPKDAASKGTAAMQFSGGYNYTLYSSFKTTNKKGCEMFEAVMSFLAERYGTEKNLVSGWILGNEVNSACIWNYGGNKSLDAYMENYARAFHICYNAVKSFSKNSNVYISLDSNWNTDSDGAGRRYFSSKATLDAFYAQLKAKGAVSFRIAYHAYPQGMGDPIFWDDTLASNSVNAKIVNFKNLSVLTKYAKKKFGKDCKIMLSEQSFNSSRGEAVQAAAYAYAYYASEGNSMIEAFIYGREFDHPSEMNLGYRWGLSDSAHTKRLVWHVFQYIDSHESFSFTDPLLGYTNLKKWNKISGFKNSICTKMPSKLKKAAVTSTYSASATSVAVEWNRIPTADGYEIYRDGTLAGTVSGGSTVTYTDEGLTKGGTYQYQVRMYKNAPAPGNAAKSVKLYGALSDGVNVTVTAGTPEFNESRCSVDGSMITVAWRKMTDVDGFEVFRSNQADSGYVHVATIAGDKSAYKDSNTVTGATYYYKVRSYVVIGGVAQYSNFSEPTEKQALVRLTARIENGNVVLSWEHWPNAARYRIFYKTQAQSDADYSHIMNVRQNPYFMPQSTYHFAVGTTYCFRVRPVYGDGTPVELSNVVELLIDDSINTTVPDITEPSPDVTEPSPDITEVTPTAP